MSKECPKCHGVYTERDLICPTCKEKLVYCGDDRQAVVGKVTQPAGGSLATQLGIAGLNKRTIGIIILIIGIFIVMIGIGLIIVSPNLLFTRTVGTRTLGYLQEPITETTDLRTVSLLCGVGLLIFGGVVSAVGGITSALGFSQFRSTQPTTSPAPTTQPSVTQSVSPKSVELGGTPDEVQSVMGRPDKAINLGARVIHVYKDMKIIYDDGKVSDVQLS